MSGETSEGTAFVLTGCHGAGQSRCRACGHRTYALINGVPRCLGCRRFVLKDEAATLGSPDVDVPVSESNPLTESRVNNEPLTLAKLEALMDPPMTDAFDRAILEGSDIATGDEMLGLRDRIMGKKPEPPSLPPPDPEAEGKAAVAEVERWLRGE